MLVVALALALAAAPESRPVGEFHAIANAGSWRVVVNAGDKAAVSVDAEDPAEAALVRTEVKDAVLHIDCAGRCTLKKKLTVTVTVKGLDALEHSGSGEVVVSGAAKDLRLGSNGSGAVSFDGAIETLKVNASGSGATTLKGTATSLQLSLSGSGKTDAGAFVVKDGKVAVSGSGSVVVNASVSLEASVSGSGSVVYLGNPSVKKAISGSGRVTGKDAPAKAVAPPTGGGW